MRLTLLVAATLLAATPVARAEDLDVAFKVGGAVGKVQSTENKAAGVAPIGGAVLGISTYFDLSRNWTTLVTPEFAIDASSMSILRKGVQAGILYHILGGAKRLQRKLFNANIDEENSYNLSLLLKSAYFDYTAIDPEGRVAPIKGGIVENSVGIEYRLNLGPSFSLGFQVSSTVLVFPASVEGLTTSIAELGLFVRTYL